MANGLIEVTRKIPIKNDIITRKIIISQQYTMKKNKLNI